MAFAPFEVYIHQMLPQKIGFPMYYPTPQSNHPLVLRERGTSIGDVGVIQPDGWFQYAFNTLARPPGADFPSNREVDDSGDPLINYYGVPDGFEPMPWDPRSDVRSDGERKGKKFERKSEGVTSDGLNTSLDASMGDG